MKKCKDKIAIEAGYSNWEVMEDFIINHNSPENVAILLVSYMEAACLLYHKTTPYQGKVNKH